MKVKNEIRNKNLTQYLNPGQVFALFFGCGRGLDCGFGFGIGKITWLKLLTGNGIEF